MEFIPANPFTVMHRPTLLALCVLAAAVAAPSRARGQLTLGGAIREADRFAYGNRIAAAMTRVQAAQAIAPLEGIVPTVRFEAGYVRTTDPIGVFGSTLRQRSISPANFDPQRLNYPASLGNYQAAIVMQQPIFNADAWIGRRSARHGADAGRASEEWSRAATRVNVVRAYYGAVLATERVSMLRAAVQAGRAHVAQAEAMVRQGLVTKSDALLASVRAGEIEAQLAEAEGSAATVRRQFTVLLGGTGDELSPGPLLPAALPSGHRIRAVLSADTIPTAPGGRADVRAASEGFGAARTDALRARSTYLPRLNSFARYDWNSARRPYAGDGNWTAGIMASWSPFIGARDLADVQGTRGRAAAARAQLEAAEANARMEAEQTRTALIVALARLAIAERAVAQSAEAHRIVGRKYAGGLATAVEVLDAQSVANQSALSLAQARWTAVVAGAERRRALGRDPGTLEAFDTPDVRVAGAPVTMPDSTSR